MLEKAPCSLPRAAGVMVATKKDSPKHIKLSLLLLLCAVARLDGLWCGHKEGFFDDGWILLGLLGGPIARLLLAREPVDEAINLLVFVVTPKSFGQAIGAHQSV